MIMITMMMIIIIMEDTYWEDPDVSSHIQRHKRVTLIIMLIDLIGDNVR
jgi:hypothetical protein